MKKILLAFLILFSVQAKSQILISLLFGDKLNSEWMEFGLEGGINYSNISNLETSNYQGQWNLGFYFNIRVQEQWSVFTGVMVKSNQGVGKLTDGDLHKLNFKKYTDLNLVDIEGEYSQRMQTFQVPILMRYNFKNNIYVALGPQGNLSYRSWIQFDSDVNGKDGQIKDTNTEQINRFDVGVTIATGYRLMDGKGWTINAKYYYGFIDTYKDIKGTKNSSFFATLCIPIGVEDKKASKSDESNK